MFSWVLWAILAYYGTEGGDHGNLQIIAHSSEAQVTTGLVTGIWRGGSLVGPRPYLVGLNTVSRKIVSELSYIIGHSAGVRELPGMGRTPIHLVVRSVSVVVEESRVWKKGSSLSQPGNVTQILISEWFEALVIISFSGQGCCACPFTVTLGQENTKRHPSRSPEFHTYSVLP